MDQFDGKYTSANSGAQYTYRAFIDRTGFRAVIRNAQDELVGQPSIVHPQFLEDTVATRRQACKVWVESCIDDSVGIR